MSNARMLALFFLMVMLIITYPSVNTELSALGSTPMDTAISITVPIAMMLAFFACVGVIGYDLFKGGRK